MPTEDEELRLRGVSVAENLNQRRLIAHAKGDGAKHNGDEYIPLLVRKKDAETTLKLLSIVEESTADLARLVDVVSMQARLLASQEREIARMRVEIERIRKEQVVTVVTNQMNQDLLAAAERGLAIEDYACEVQTTSTYSEGHDHGGGVNVSGQGRTQGNVSGEAEIGNVLDMLKGARLQGTKTAEALRSIATIVQGRSIVAMAHAEQAKASIKVGKLSPADFKK